MITIDAIGRDGTPALAGLDGSSPSGGFVTTESRDKVRLVPGDVVRDNGAWSVVADVRHNGLSGITTAAMIRADLTITRRTLFAYQSAEVRTDARIDPGSLWKLADLAGKVSLVKTYVPALAMAS